MTMRVQRPSLKARAGPLRHIHRQPPPRAPCLLIMHLLITTKLALTSVWVHGPYSHPD